MAKKNISKENGRDYKKMIKYCVVIVVILFVLCFNYFYLQKFLSMNNSYINDFEEVEGENPNIRKPAVAGLFYSSNKEALDKEVSHYLKVSSEFEEHPSMLIVPHAGYVYSGSVAGRAYSLLKPYSKDIKKVFIVGPSHFEYLDGFALSSKKYFKTPLGKVSINRKINQEIIKNNNKTKVFDAAHAKEHSIEVQLPFLQKVLDDFEIIPVAYGSSSSEELANLLKPYIFKKDSIIIFSADLSHYQDYHTAQELDNYTNDLILKNEADLSEKLSCGYVGINAALILSKENNFYPKVINLKNSGDVSGKEDSVVGYGAWSFSSDVSDSIAEKRGVEAEVISLENFAKIYKNEILSIANISLEDASRKEGIYKPSREEYSNKMFDKGASFVTLRKNGKLRGCVGSVIPSVSIAQDIANSSYSAALSDTRFDSLTIDELKDITLSVSLLTSLERIRFLDENELISKIELGLDGLVIIDGNRQGLLLPSVWEEITNKEEFLKALKLKAGMSPAYWSNRIKIYRFRTVEVSKDEY